MRQRTGSSDPRLARIQGLIREIPDFPRPGIAFKDITPLLADAAGFRDSVDLLAERLGPEHVEAVVAIESRGFVFGAALAYRLGVSLVPVRKPGKLPAEVRRVDYELEYGYDALEMHHDSLPPMTRTVICDDLIATGGTAAATGDLLRGLGIEPAAYAFVVELSALGGRSRLGGVPVVSLVRY